MWYSGDLFENTKESRMGQLQNDYITTAKGCFLVVCIGGIGDALGALLDGRWFAFVGAVGVATCCAVMFRNGTTAQLDIAKS